MNRLSLLAAALSASCSGAYSVDNVCLTAVKAQCHFDFSCCTETERNVVGGGNFAFGQATDEASCVDLASKIQCGRFTEVSDSVKAGRFSYDENKAAACWDPVVQAADKCDAESFFIAQQRLSSPVCDPFAGKGLVAQGAFCFVNEECADNGECVVAHEANVVTAEGRCGAPPPAAGAPCAPDGFCGTGSICSGFVPGGEGEGEGSGPPPPPPPTPVCEPFIADGKPCPNGAQFCESGTCGGNPPVCGKASVGETFDICKGGTK